jgi:hypothetical protein
MTDKSEAERTPSSADAWAAIQTRLDARVQRAKKPPKRKPEKAQNGKKVPATRPEVDGDARRIFEYVRKSGERGATLEETVSSTKLQYQAGSARFSEMTQTKCFLPTGEKRYTSKGSQAEVYRLAEGATYEMYQERRPVLLWRGKLREEAMKLCRTAVAFKAAYENPGTRDAAVSQVIETLVEIAEKIGAQGVGEWMDM